jgi:hypothetical protein
MTLYYEHTGFYFIGDRRFRVKHECVKDEIEGMVIDSSIYTFPYWAKAYTIIINNISNE